LVNFEQMRGLLIFITVLLSSTHCMGQTKSAEDTPFNDQIEHKLGLGFAITGFNSNFTYFVSPHYSFRYHRHWFGFTPFYGRLDALPKHQDIGVGIDYRLYPFKNQNATLLYFPVGVHYNYKWTDSSQKTAMLYQAGFGVEALLGKRFAISLDANFGVSQTLTSIIAASESATFRSGNALNFYFIPVIRVSYGL